ncbi:MAG: hypothetical protein KF861_19230, partial [Planctomycetaceae bacterium]|nr:hypothetical protein [Planctomycetaceae bacterium]
MAWGSRGCTSIPFVAVTRFLIVTAVFLLIQCSDIDAGERSASEAGLVGYWKLQDDCEDSSGNGNHGVNHGVDLATGTFSGRGDFIEVRDAPSLQWGAGDFSVSAWVWNPRGVTDVPGDLVSKFDLTHRRGFNLSLGGNTSGYNGPSDLRQLSFGIDNGAIGRWTDCGRPTDKSHSSDAATVYNGDLYVGTIDAKDEADWAHVYRYLGGQEWEDVGRLGSRRTRGIYAMVVHDGALYAATTSSHNRQPPDMDFGRVYRYLGGQEWEDIGQPGEYFHLSGMASFDGKLYVAAYSEDQPGHCFVYEGDRQWRDCGTFEGYPHSLAVHDGRIHLGYPGGHVFASDGGDWEDLGNPFGAF